MEIIKTSDKQIKPPVIMLVYGNGGCGKTTFSSTAPKPLLVDLENGSKYLGLRGIEMDVAKVEKWADMKEVLDIAKGDEYQTIVIDPLDELMYKIRQAMIAANDAKLVQKDGNPTMAGWGWMKNIMRNYLKALRDSGKHVILIAHIEEKDDEGRLIKRPKVETKISQDIIDMVDVVGYMEIVSDGEESKRVIRVEEKNDRYEAKDRTGQLGKIIPPDFMAIINACQGNEVYAWSSDEAKKIPTKKKEAKKDVVKEEVSTPTAKDVIADKIAKAKAKTVAKIDVEEVVLSGEEVDFE